MFFVMRVNINQEGKQSNSIQMYDKVSSAMKRFYNVLAADIENENYAYEQVLVTNEDGLIIASQVFKHDAPEEVTQ